MILDNNGYSNNNESYQGEGNNLYPNGSTQETKQTKGIFLLGLLGGVAISTLLTVFVYVGGRLVSIYSTKNMAPVSTEDAATEDAFDDTILIKMKTIRDVIDEYYSFINNYPDSKHAKEAATIFKIAEKHVKR